MAYFSPQVSDADMFQAALVFIGGGLFLLFFLIGCAILVAKKGRDQSVS